MKNLRVLIIEDEVNFEEGEKPALEIAQIHF